MRIKQFIAAGLLISGIVSCKKEDTLNSSLNSRESSNLGIASNTGMKPRANYKSIFLTYTKGVNSGSNISYTNLLTNVTKDAFGYNPAPFYMHYEDSESNIIWGMNGSDFGYYNLEKTSAENIDNEYIQNSSFGASKVLYIDKLYNRMFFANTEKGGKKGFDNLCVIYMNGTGFDRIYKTTGDILSPIFANNKLYYVSLAHNALMEYDLGTRIPKILIKNFNLACSDGFYKGFEEEIANNTTFLKRKKVKRSLNSTGLGFFTIDNTNNKVFWLRDNQALIKKPSNNTENPYNYFRPSLMCANLDGSNVQVLDDHIGYIKKEDYKAFYPFNLYLKDGAIKVDPDTKRIYVAMELIKEEPCIDKPNLYNVSDNLSFWSCDYSGQNHNWLSQLDYSGVVKNPANWNNLSVSNIDLNNVGFPVYYTSNLEGMVFYHGKVEDKF